MPAEGPEGARQLGVARQSSVTSGRFASVKRGPEGHAGHRHHGGGMRGHRSLVASAFALFVSIVGVLGSLGPADAATVGQLPIKTVCPVGSTLILSGTYSGLCKTSDGIVFDPTTGRIVSSPLPTPTPLPLPVDPGSLLPTIQPPPPGGQPNPGTGTTPKRPSNPSRPSHLISSSIASSHSYGTPYGMYFGNVGGAGTYFGPNDGLTKYQSYRQLYYVGAFGQPLESDVSTVVVDSSDVAPVSTNLVPHAPDEVWLLLPFGLVLITVISYLVLEPDSDRVLA